MRRIITAHHKHSFFWDTENITRHLHTQNRQDRTAQQNPSHPSQAAPSLHGHALSFFVCQLDKSPQVSRQTCRRGKLTANTHSESQAWNSQNVLSCFLPLSEESSFLDRIFLFRPRLPFFVSPPFSPSPPSRPEQLSACLAIVFYSVEEKKHNKKYNIHRIQDQIILALCFQTHFW